MNLWQKGKRRMLRSVRIRSLKDTSLRLGTPVFLVLMGLGIAIMLIVRMQKIKKIKMEKIKRDEEKEGK